MTKTKHLQLHSFYFFHSCILQFNDFGIQLKLSPRFLLQTCDKNDLNLKKIAARTPETIKLLKTTEWICCFLVCLPKCKKSASYLRSVLRYNIWNYFCHAQLCLTTPIWMTESNRCTYVCLSTCKQSTLKLS